MPTIIVCTNFSDTSRNALLYACSLLQNKGDKAHISILLLHIYTISVNYSGDGIALVTIDDALKYAEEDLHTELEWAHQEYPGLQVSGKITTGRLLDGLKEGIEETQASLVILGTGGNYGDLWSWDSNIISALRDLPAPVLTIPPNVAFKPVQNIAFACNLKNVSAQTPFKLIKNLVEFTEAKLHVIYVTVQPVKAGSKEAGNERWVHEQLEELQPIYHTIYENLVVGAIGRFIENHQIQLLLVIPRKHGLWESLFHKSHTEELARLNRLPIMALH